MCSAFLQSYAGVSGQQNVQTGICRFHLKMREYESNLSCGNYTETELRYPEFGRLEHWEA